MQFPAILGSAGRNPPSPWEETRWDTQLTSHMENTHGPHTTNPHSDSSYPNIFYRIPALSTFQSTHIYRTTGHKIMVQVEGL